MRSVTPQRFARVADTVYAVQVTEHNGEELARWCGGHYTRLVKTVQPPLVADTIDVPDFVRGYRKAHIGDWIIKNDEGDFYPISEENFQDRYWKV